MSSNVAFRLTLVDLNDQPGIFVGENFALEGSFVDIRTQEQSVFSGFSDVNFDSTFVQVEEIDYTDAFGFGRTGVINNDIGLVDEVGAISSSFSATAPTPTFRLNMTALTAGSTIISADAGDEFLSEITVFGLDGDQRENTSFQDLTIDILPILPTVQVGDQIVNEGDGNAGILVTLSEASDTTITVEYATEAGTATSDQDYDSQTGTLTFLPGETEQIIDVAIVDDLVFEAEETLFINLQNTEGARLEETQSEITIQDNDQILISIDDISINEADGKAQFTVSLSNPSDFEITVDFATSDGDAIAFQDYRPTSGTLTFAPGEISQTLDIELIDDLMAETTESFQLILSNSTGAELTISQGTGTIFDSDVPITRIINGTSGRDTLIGTPHRNIISGLGDSDVIIGGLGDDIVFGGEGDDILRGDFDTPLPGGQTGGDDILFGGAGNDRIGGKAGNDFLFGNSGDDQIWGDDGDDLLWGGAGNDILTGDDNSGGQGYDTFVLAIGEGTDTILDFQIGEDVIGLGNGLTFGQLEIVQTGSSTQISLAASEEILGVLEQVRAEELLSSSDSFVSV